MISPAELAQAIRDRFTPETVLAVRETPPDPWLEIAPAEIAAVCGFLRDDPQFLFDHLNDLCAVDWCAPNPAKAAKFGHPPHLEIVYHLSSYTTRQRAVLKVLLPRWQGDVPGELPDLPSVSGVWPIAVWHEREAYDLMGVRFTGHPQLTRILLPEDWIGHPLRKDYLFPEEYHGIRCN